jgi:hypothetical protein
MGIKRRELGVISVDAGDVVCFSMDRCLDIAERLKLDVDDFIKLYDGVECDFRADGGYGVDQVTAVQDDGETFDMVMIGGDVTRLRRFLNEDEGNFHEFIEAHPRSKEIGFGENFNHALFAEIAEEYHQKLLAKPCNLQG